MQSATLDDRVTSAYEEKVRAGAIEPDAAQNDLVRELDAFLSELEAYESSKKRGALGRLLTKKASKPRGFYIFGEVGRGKTMLMDLLYEAARVRAKRRVHFHSFMQDVHARIHAWRQSKVHGRTKGSDPIAPVADQLVAQAWFLCFDEFAVTDIADAMLLARLFSALFERGCVVVATSNVEPANLYLGGLNRALFLPFITIFEKNVVVVKLDSRTDFRLEKLDDASVYYSPVDEHSRIMLDDLFQRLSGQSKGAPFALSFLGRTFTIREASNRVAKITFDELCRQPLGAADYLAIAEHFHTIVLSGVPVMRLSDRNEAKRFITLIDTLYDRGVKLVMSAEAPPNRLYLAEDGREAFEFQRTSSRLVEMQSRSYLALPHGLANLKEKGEDSGIVET
jgi:cell division protein ZapE